MIPVIGHDSGLGKTFGFVIDRAWTDRVDVSPVALILGMYLRITVAFRGRRMEISRGVALCNLQRVEGAIGANAQCFGPQPRVVCRAGRRGQIEDIIDWSRVEWITDILFQQREAPLARKMFK